MFSRSLDISFDKWELQSRPFEKTRYIINLLFPFKCLLIAERWFRSWCSQFWWLYRLTLRSRGIVADQDQRATLSDLHSGFQKTIKSVPKIYSLCAETLQSLVTASGDVSTQLPIHIKGKVLLGVYRTGTAFITKLPSCDSIKLLSTYQQSALVMFWCAEKEFVHKRVGDVN